MSQSNGVVHLWELPPKKTYLDLDKNFKINMLQAAKEIVGTWKNLADKIDEDENVFYHMKSGQKVKLNVIMKLSRFLNKNGNSIYSKRKIEKKTRIIGTMTGNASILEPKLPFDFSTKAGCTFISAIMFDGGMGKELKPYYGNTCLPLRENLKQCALSFFGKIRNKESNPKRGFMIRFPKIVGLILNHCLKIKFGKKVYLDPSLPEFIFSSSEDAKSAFLRQAFDDDGWVSVKSKELGIGITKDITNLSQKERELLQKTKDPSFAPRLLWDIKKLLQSIGIPATTPQFRGERILMTDHGKDGPFYRSEWRVFIRGRRNIENFSQIINFNLRYKHEQLEELINNYEEYQLQKGKIYPITLKIASKIVRENGFFTKSLIAEDLEKTYSYAAKVVRVLKRRKMVKEIDSGNQKWNVKYTVTEKGRNLIGLHNV